MLMAVGFRKKPLKNMMSVLSDTAKQLLYGQEGLTGCACQILTRIFRVWTVHNPI